MPYNESMIPMRRYIPFILAVSLLAGCQHSPAPGPSTQQQIAEIVTQTVGAMSPAATHTLAPLARPRVVHPAVTGTPAPSLPPPVLLTPAPAPPVFDEPAGCRKPSDEAGERVEVNGWVLNQRTLGMLRYAQELYGGAIDLSGAAINQGSYHDNGAASFGTHLGGGAVDLSVFLPGTWTVDFAHLNRLVRSLRAAGFAAWVRVPDEAFPGSGWHIHAIAIGDPELSKEAQDQLTGTYGYFLGYNGLPQANGVPISDRDGPVVLCRWMAERGYSLPEGDAPPAGTWQERLAAAANSFLTNNQEETLALSRRLGMLGTEKSLRLLDVALAGALWNEAGLAPKGPNARTRPGQVDVPPTGISLAQALFASEDFEHLRFEVSPREFDFRTFELRAGDLLVLNDIQHTLVITSVDADGQAWTVVPLQGEHGQWRVVRASLTGPGGLLEKEWAGEKMNSFVIHRSRWTAPRPFEYPVHPGDTREELGAWFGVRVEGPLEVGQVIVIK